MTFQIKQQPPPMEHVGLRLPPEIRERAKALAREQGADESKVYRTIIEGFFWGDEATTCSQNEQSPVASAEGGEPEQA